MRFRGNISLIAMPDDYAGEYERFAKETIEKAARIWVRTAADIIPVWSGASMATLEALGNAVGESVSVFSLWEAPDRISLGRLNSSGGLTRHGPGSWGFYYETQLRYLVINETQRVAPRTHGLFGSLREPTPYNFRVKADEAVKEYLAKVPAPKLYLSNRK